MKLIEDQIREKLSESRDTKKDEPVEEVTREEESFEDVES
jgi:hypothetical protein